MTKVPPVTAYTVICHDRSGPEPARLRKELAPAHFAHVERILDRILVAGPLRDEAGESVGSLLILNAGSESEARDLIAGDPYADADIWASVEVHPFLTAAGQWIGGKIW